MRTLIILAATALLTSVSAAGAQTNSANYAPPDRLDLRVSEPDNSISPMRRPDQPAALTDVAQVKQMLKARGFTNVTVVPRHADGQRFDVDGQWLAQGTLDGRQVAVIVNQNGTVTPRS